MGLRFEAWTLPWSASFERKIADIPVVEGGGSGLIRLNDTAGEGSIAIPAGYERLDEIIDSDTGSLIRVYDDSTIIQEFLAERVVQDVGEAPIVTISGADLSAVFDRVIVYPFDYPASPSVFRDHIYGGPNLLANPTGHETTLNEIQRLTITSTADGETTLDGAIDDQATTTTVTVADASVFPAPPFTILIDSEQMDVSAVTGNDLTVARGDAGTTRAAHADGATVTEVPSGSFTLTFDGQTTSALPWNPNGTAAFHTDASEVAAALVALSNVAEVSVTGNGEPGSAFDIEFLDPGGEQLDEMTASDSINSASISIFALQDGGFGDPHPWTRSRNPNTGLDHGTYGAPPIRASVTGLGEPADSIRVWALSIYGGAQQVVDVTPGGQLQASVEVQPGETGDYRLVVRDLNENLIGASPSGSGGTTLSSGSFTEMSISDMTVPDGVDKVIFRIATVDPDTSTETEPFFFKNAVLQEGAAESTVGTIVTDLMDDAASDHSGDTRGTILDWVDYSGFDGTNDSSSTAWSENISFTAFRGMSYGQVFDRLVELGYEWRLVPKASPSGGKTHDLEFYGEGNLGTDYVSAGSSTPAINVGQAVVKGSGLSRIPDYTAVLVEGEGGAYVEDSDATALSNFGRFERYHGDTALASSTSLAAVGDFLLAEESDNRRAFQLTIRASENHPRPLVDYKPGDTIYVQLPPLLSKTSRRVQSVAWRNTVPATYEVVL